MSFVSKLREKFKMMLSIDRPPSVMAWASALGMLIGISPYVGVQTYIALLVSGWFNLPVYPLLIGVYITNPITIPFIFGLTTKFGMFLLGMDCVICFDWNNITWHGILETGKALLLPFLVGTHAAGIILSIPTYFIVYFLFKYLRRKKNKNLLTRPDRLDIKKQSGKSFPA